MIRLWDHFFQPFQVLGLRLKQTTEVVLHRALDRPRALAERLTEAIANANEPPTNRRQQTHVAARRRVFLTTSGTVPIMFYLAISCVLIKLALSLLTHKNQSDKSDKVEIGVRYLVQVVSKQVAYRIALRK